MTPSQIANLLGGKLIGSPFMKVTVCEAISLLPEEMIRDVTKDVWFLSSPDDAWALTLRGSDVENNHLIYLSDELLNENSEQIKFTVLHEIGHVILNHENSVGRVQTQSEIKKQEFEADQFARKYLKNF